jgi:hypothetical protein
MGQGFRILKFWFSLVVYFHQVWLQHLSKVLESLSSCYLLPYPSHHLGSSLISFFKWTDSRVWHEFYDNKSMTPIEVVTISSLKDSENIDKQFKFHLSFPCHNWGTGAPLAECRTTVSYSSQHFLCVRKNPRLTRDIKEQTCHSPGA